MALQKLLPALLGRRSGHPCKCLQDRHQSSRQQPTIPPATTVESPTPSGQWPKQWRRSWCIISQLISRLWLGTPPHPYQKAMLQQMPALTPQVQAAEAAPACQTATMARRQLTMPFRFLQSVLQQLPVTMAAFCKAASLCKQHHSQCRYWTQPPVAAQTAQQATCRKRCRSTLMC